MVASRSPIGTNFGVSAAAQIRSEHLDDWPPLTHLASDSVDGVSELLGVLASVQFVPDILFEDALYCLLDYYPKGKARGRVFSIRFGIIGKSWRSETTELRSSVSGDRENLIMQWGMTSDEADQQQPQALLCYILRAKGEPVGLLFVDTEENAFAQDICAELDACEYTQQLADAVDTVTREMRKAGASHQGALI